MTQPPTPRGRHTRERILYEAARLFHAQGVTATSLDELLAAAEAGRGQFYRYFSSKEELAAAVVERQIEQYLRFQLERLERLERLEELEAYLDDLVVDHRERELVGGCPVGALALELTGQDPALAGRLAEALERWRSSLSVGLSRLVAREEIRTDTSAERLASLMLASIQGAYLLSTVEGDVDVMGDALRATLLALRAPRSADPARGTR